MPPNLSTESLTELYVKRSRMEREDRHSFKRFHSRSSLSSGLCCNYTRSFNIICTLFASNPITDTKKLSETRDCAQNCKSATRSLSPLHLRLFHFSPPLSFRRGQQLTEILGQLLDVDLQTNEVTFAS